MVTLVALTASLQLGEHFLGSQCLLTSQMVSARKTVQRMGKTRPGPHKGLGPIILRDPDTHRGHGKMDM